MKYNLRAWRLYRKGEGLSFAECLHRAWLSEKAAPINAQRIDEAREAAGITEECNTWSAWREAGYEVIHGSKSLFGADLIWGTKGDGATYKARFFSRSKSSIKELLMTNEMNTACAIWSIGLDVESENWLSMSDAHFDELYR